MDWATETQKAQKSEKLKSTKKVDHNVLLLNPIGRCGDFIIINTFLSEFVIRNIIKVIVGFR